MHAYAAGRWRSGRVGRRELANARVWGRSQLSAGAYAAYGTAKRTADAPRRARTSPAAHRQERLFLLRWEASSAR